MAGLAGVAFEFQLEVIATGFNRRYVQPVINLVVAEAN
jgi:hypothetical protein